NSDPGTALANGEIDIACWTDGRTNELREAGNKNIQFELPDPDSPSLSICMMKVKNGADSAWKYLDCAAMPENQAAWNKYFPGYYMTVENPPYGDHSKKLQDPTALNG